MIPFVSPVVDAISSYFQMTVADPCTVLLDRAGKTRQIVQPRRVTPSQFGMPSARLRQHAKLPAAVKPMGRLAAVLDLFRARPERFSPDVPYVPLRADESLTEHYLASVYLDEFGSAHPRMDIRDTDQSRLELLVLPAAH